MTTLILKILFFTAIIATLYISLCWFIFPPLMRRKIIRLGFNEKAVVLINNFFYGETSFTAFLMQLGILFEDERIANAVVEKLIISIKLFSQLEKGIEINEKNN